jgi:hypothetical protein
MIKGLIDQETEERVRDMAAEAGTFPEAVTKAAVDAFMKLDVDDQVDAIEKATEAIAVSRGWKRPSTPPTSPE